MRGTQVCVKIAKSMLGRDSTHAAPRRASARLYPRQFKCKLVEMKGVVRPTVEWGGRKGMPPVWSAFHPPGAENQAVMATARGAARLAGSQGAWTRVTITNINSALHCPAVATH